MLEQPFPQASQDRVTRGALQVWGAGWRDGGSWKLAPLTPVSYSADRPWTGFCNESGSLRIRLYPLANHPRGGRSPGLLAQYMRVCVFTVSGNQPHEPMGTEQCTYVVVCQACRFGVQPGEA